MFTSSPKDLALFIINKRKKLKLSQSDVAKMVGLKQQTLSDFENRPERTKISTLFRILSALNLDIKLSSKNEMTTKARWKEEW